MGWAKKFFPLDLVFYCISLGPLFPRFVCQNRFFPWRFPWIFYLNCSVHFLWSVLGSIFPHTKKVFFICSKEKNKRGILRIWFFILNLQIRIRFQLIWIGIRIKVILHLIIWSTSERSESALYSYCQIFRGTGAMTVCDVFVWFKSNLLHMYNCIKVFHTFNLIKRIQKDLLIVFLVPRYNMTVVISKNGRNSSASCEVQ